MIRFFRNIRKRLLVENRFTRYLIYAMGEIVLVVIGILIALQLNLWKEESKSTDIEHKILEEIRNGLDKDLTDIAHNMNGHAYGVRSCAYWNRVIHGQDVNMDSVGFYYWYLTRSFTLAQNTASFGSLKTRGLELITNAPLRLRITNLYEVDYASTRKLEEIYGESQFHDSYYIAINRIISPMLVFNDLGELISLDTTVQIEDDARNELMSHLWRIDRHRHHILKNYALLEDLIRPLRTSIDEELSLHAN